MVREERQNAGCLAEATVDQYCTKQLKDPELAMAEEHLLICEWCLERVRTTDALITFLRRTAADRQPKSS